MILQIHYRRLREKNKLKSSVFCSENHQFQSRSSSSGNLRSTQKVIFHLPVCRKWNHPQTRGKEVLVQKIPVKLLRMKKHDWKLMFSEAWECPSGYSGKVQHLSSTVGTKYFRQYFRQGTKFILHVQEGIAGLKGKFQLLWTVVSGCDNFIIKIMVSMHCCCMQHTPIPSPSFFYCSSLSRKVVSKRSSTSVYS